MRYSIKSIYNIHFIVLAITRHKHSIIYVPPYKNKSGLRTGGVTGYLGSLKISLCEERRLEDTQNLKCEDRRFQNCLVLTTDDLATKPTKLEDWRFKFLTGKIWFLNVINWEDRSWWYLLHYNVPIAIPNADRQDSRMTAAGFTYNEYCISLINK